MIFWGHSCASCSQSCHCCAWLFLSPVVQLEKLHLPSLSENVLKQWVEAGQEASPAATEVSHRWDVTTFGHACMHIHMLAREGVSRSSYRWVGRMMVLCLQGECACRENRNKSLVFFSHLNSMPVNEWVKKTFLLNSLETKCGQIQISCFTAAARYFCSWLLISSTLWTGEKGNVSPMGLDYSLLCFHWSAPWLCFLYVSAEIQGYRKVPGLLCFCELCYPYPPVFLQWDQEGFSNFFYEYLFNKCSQIWLDKPNYPSNGSWELQQANCVFIFQKLLFIAVFCSGKYHF